MSAAASAAGGEAARKPGLVTGAGSGIGRATALEFARTGAAVAVLDIDEAAAAETAELIRKDGGEALAVTVDIADEDSVREAVQRTVAAFGGLDFAVNNAGMASHNPNPMSKSPVRVEITPSPAISTRTRGRPDLRTCMPADLRTHPATPRPPPPSTTNIHSAYGTVRARLGLPI